MISRQSGHQAGSILILVCFLVVSGLYITFCGSSHIYDLGGDASGYILAAQHFSPFQAATPTLHVYSKEIIYPPLFPLIIGAFGGSPLAGHLVVTASLLGSFVLLYRWLTTENLGRLRPAVIVLVLALMPITYLTALNIWTENVYLMFSMLAIFAVASAEKRVGERHYYWWLAAMAVALATLTRVAALPLLVAFCLYLLVRRPPGYFRLLAAAAAPFCIWAIVAKTMQAGLGGYTAQWSVLYANDAIRIFFQSLLDWTRAATLAWQGGLAGDGAGAALFTIAGIVGLAGLIAWVDRLYRFKFDALYLLCYMAMLLAWPHPEEASRYGYVAVPLLLAYPVLLLDRLSAKLKNRAPSAASAVFLGICALMVIPSLVINGMRYNRPVQEEFKDGRKLDGWYSDNKYRSEVMTLLNLKIINHLRSAGDSVPERDCIFSVKPTVITLHTGRSSFMPPRIKASDADFEHDIRRCRFAYVMGLRSPSFNEAYYPLERLAGRARVVSATRVSGEVDSALIAALIEIAPD
jgi:hypothetical protein